MPRYFFHTHIGEHIITDEHGSEHRNPDAAWEAARAIATATMNAPEDQARLIVATIVVTDVIGEVVFEFPFAEAVTLPADRHLTMH